MSIFKKLSDSYFEIDQTLSQLELKARLSRRFRKEREYRKKRELNDLAYFLYLFSRFESKLKDVTDKLIDRKTTSRKNDRNKRAWIILKKYNKKNRLDLMHKVSLFIPADRREYNRIYDYKKQRDQIVHGGNATVVFPQVLSDMEIFSKQIR